VRNSIDAMRYPMSDATGAVEREVQVIHRPEEIYSQSFVSEARNSSLLFVFEKRWRKASMAAVMS
jgi:hypothetical protein